MTNNANCHRASTTGVMLAMACRAYVYACQMQEHFARLAEILHLVNLANLPEDFTIIEKYCRSVEPWSSGNIAWILALLRPG